MTYEDKNKPPFQVQLVQIGDTLVRNVIGSYDMLDMVNDLFGLEKSYLL